MSGIFKKIFGITAAAMIMFSSGAQALTFSTDSSLGQSVGVFGWENLLIDGASLHARVEFNLLSLNSTTAIFDVAVRNLTASNQPGQNRFVSFGVGDVSPNVSGVTVANDGSGASWSVSRNTTFPDFSFIELCVWAGNNCSGGGNGGLGEGETDFFRLTLTGTFAETISFGEPFAGRWQAVGISGESVNLPGRSVPEPGPLALFAFGIAVLAARRRHRRQ